MSLAEQIRVPDQTSSRGSSIVPGSPARGVRRRRFALPALVVGLAALAITASSASAGQTHVPLGFFCEPSGEGPLPCEPSFDQTYDLAVQRPGGELIVLDSGAGEILRFKPNGEPDPFSALGGNAIDGKRTGVVNECPTVPADCDETPENGFTFGFFAQEAQLSVDNSGTEADGNIYLTQSGFYGEAPLVNVFDSTGAFRGQLTGTSEGPFGEDSRIVGVTVDQGGNVFLADSKADKIYRCVPAGEVPVNGDCSLISDEVDDPGRLAAGAGPSAGALFASERFGRVFKLGPDGAIQCAVHDLPEDEDVMAVAVNPADGHVFASDSKSGEVGTYEYDATGCTASAEAELVSRFDGARTGIAIDDSSGPKGRVYLNAASHVEVYSGLVPLPDPVTEVASNIGEISATLNGTVATNGEVLTECFFEYVAEVSYEPKAANPYAAGESVPCAESPAEIGTGTAQVHADLGGLGVETAYHYRLLAANANGAAEPQGQDRTFQTVSRPEILATWAAGVTFTEATIKAQINPHSAATAYRFEWGESAAAPYENATAEISIGAGATPQTVSLLLSGLTPGGTYHFRVVAENRCRPESDPEEICTSEGPDRVLTTYRTPQLGPCPNDALRGGAAAALPDCRAYEMVSPVDKNGADIVNALPTVSGGKPIGAGDPGGYVQVSPDGERIAYAARFPAFGEPANSFIFNQYLADRGPGGWGSEAIHPPYEGRPAAPVAIGVLREFIAFTPDLCSAWLIDFQTPPLKEDAQLEAANLYRRDNCAPGRGDLETLTTGELPPGFDPVGYVDSKSVQGVSEDGRHAIFAARWELTGEAAPGDPAKAQLYDRFGGANRLVSVLPGGVAASTNAVPGSGWGGNLQGAVSADGSRVYWTSGGAEGRIYLRSHPEQGIVKGECTKQTKACTTPVSASAKAFFWAAAEDGSAALYSEGEDLYLFDAASGESQLIAAGVRGVAGASEDLARIYFVSDAVLPGSGQNSEEDEAVAGEPNLYLAEGGDFAFVGTLVEGDVGQPEPGAFGTTAYNLIDRGTYRRATRVTPDGGRIVFQSRAPLTGFDNVEEAGGKAAVEVFTYEASGDLRCVSCNPSRARPLAREMTEPYNPRYADQVFPKVQAAAWIPTWEHPLHASNVVSREGTRIFFNANDALLPRDTNGTQDVYEWEAVGTGSCTAQDPNHFARNGGCLYLISSGESSFESELWEASPDGRDVFFITAQSLLPQDPGSIDLYDAQVEGGIPQPPVKEPCEGEACQSPPPPPEYPTPASSSFRGPGNVSPARRCRRPAGQARRRRARRLAGKAKRRSGAARRCRKRARANRRAAR